MGIDLGLGRVTRLLAELGNPHKSTWKAIHIAGTNGKGSICAYLSSIFTSSKLKTGKFTSPHLVHKWDCISLNNKPISYQLFRNAEEKVLSYNDKLEINATEFEIMTAIAFQIFKEQACDIAIIEVGMGGLLDATNVLEPANDTEDGQNQSGVLVTVIAKVGLDHESFLGSTVQEIAAHKAGIIKDGVPCVIDGSNELSVISTVSEIARKKKSPLIVARKTVTTSGEVHVTSALTGSLPVSVSPLLGEYQADNLACALACVDVVKRSSIGKNITKELVIEGIKHTYWPGRLDWISCKSARDAPVRRLLLDGAHNEQAATLLGKYIDSHVRQDSEAPITYVLGFTKGKNIAEILRHLLRKDDRVIVTSFGPVEGMPWIKSENYDTVCETIQRIGVLDSSSGSDKLNVEYQPNIPAALERLDETKEDRPVVVCGSLYLVSELIKLQIELDNYRIDR